MQEQRVWVGLSALAQPRLTKGGQPYQRQVFAGDQVPDGGAQELSIQPSTQSSTQSSIQSSQFTTVIRHLSSIQPSTLPLPQGMHFPDTLSILPNRYPPTANRLYLIV